MQDRLLERRSLLALGTSAVLFSLAKKGQSMATEQERKDGKGQPGEFDFLIGDWKIKNRRLKGPNQWDEFEGESTCWSVLNGVGSIEELRIPARNFFGMGLRLLDRETGLGATIGSLRRMLFFQVLASKGDSKTVWGPLSRTTWMAMHRSK